ncbi:MAG: hypothetical protein II165_05760 [Bacteroidales bacterium]|nr:hypothetical protein [Bacteroidales bacterium]
MEKITNLLLMLLLLMVAACEKTDDTQDLEEEIFNPGDKKVGLVLSGGGAKARQKLAH